ncbi:MAG: mechanosensitive ion channel family protein [Deltaproteobacteria bacterium]|nr:MAG: mechanosensitive ion channel family protein [Deltaproteobacteria bacterium]
MDTEELTKYADEAVKIGMETGSSMIWSILAGGAICVVGWMVSKWIAKLVVASTERAKLDLALGRFLSQIARYAVLVGTGVSALATMGFEVTTFVAVLGAAGFAVGLALQGTLGHFASGVMILIFRPIGLGDFVVAGGSTGTVKEIGLFQTVLLSPDNQTIFVPNGSVTGGTIINFTRQGTRRAEIDVGVAYGADLKEVEQACLQAIEGVQEILPEPPPAFAFVEMADSSLNFKLRAWCNAPDYLLVMHKMRSAVYDELNARHIEIPFPQVVVHKAED